MNGDPLPGPGYDPPTMSADALLAEHRLLQPPHPAECACGEWKAPLGESTWRSFDKHLIDVREKAAKGEALARVRRWVESEVDDYCDPVIDPELHDALRIVVDLPPVDRGEL